MKLQGMHKLQKPKDNISINRIIYLILIIIVLLTIIINAVLYFFDIILAPYLTYLFVLVFNFKNFKSNRKLKRLGMITFLIILITFSVKPKYTISEAKKIIETEINEEVGFSRKNLGYPIRKNVLVRGAYTFINKCGHIIIFDNYNGNFNIVK